MFWNICNKNSTFYFPVFSFIHICNRSKMGGNIPDRWIPYNAKGEVIEGTRFICFKVPLKLSMQNGLSNKWDTQTLLKSIPNLGLVVDLTFTTRYYNPNDITSMGVQYQKILCPGRELPPTNIVNNFFSVIDGFLQSDSEKLIGIHCTHGLNRTGYFVCRYMRDKMGIPADEAIKAFEVARGYKIERENFLADLRGETPPPSDLGKHTKIIPLKSSNEPKYAKDDNNKRIERSTGYSNKSNRYERSCNKNNTVNNIVEVCTQNPHNSGIIRNTRRYGETVYYSSSETPRIKNNYDEQRNYNGKYCRDYRNLNNLIYDNEQRNVNDFCTASKNSIDLIQSGSEKVEYNHGTRNTRTYPSNDQYVQYRGRIGHNHLMYDCRSDDRPQIKPSTSNSDNFSMKYGTNRNLTSTRARAPISGRSRYTINNKLSPELRFNDCVHVVNQQGSANSGRKRNAVIEQFSSIFVQEKRSRHE